MTTNRAIDLLDRYAGLQSRQSAWLKTWQECADLLHPTRGGFTAELTEGEEAQYPIYDSTPMQARRALATTIDGLLKPASSVWFWMKAINDELNEDDEAKRWFDAVGQRMRDAIYSPASRFIQQSNAVDNDLATFGLGYLWIAENRNRNGLTFRSIHIRDAVIDENSDGEIDTIDVCRRYTARQAEQRWGREALGKKVIEALTSTDPKARDTIFTFVQCVYPNAEKDNRRIDRYGMDFASTIVCKEDQNIVEESGFHEFPAACPRWEIVPNQIYPRGPGMMALPDARTLQSMGHTLLVGGEKAVDPPVWAVDDGMMSTVRTWPGGLTIVNAETVKDTGGRPLGVLEMGKNIPIGREMQQDYRTMVDVAFYRDLFGMPEDKTDETKFYWQMRNERFVMQIGPILGQLEADYPGAIVKRVFGIMQRAGALPPVPEILQNSGARFEFKSPIQQAKRQIEMAGLAKAFEFIAPIAEFKPDVVDNFDPDEIVRDFPDALGLPQRWLKPKDQVEADREQRQELQQAAMAMQGAGAVADVGKTVTEADKNMAQSAQMMEQQAA